MKKYFLLTLLILSFENFSNAQFSGIGIGVESQYSGNNEISYHNALRVEGLFNKNSLSINLSGGFILYRPASFNLGYFTVGGGFSKYFRPDKIYKPAINLNLHTTLKRPSNSMTEQQVFSFHQVTSGATFKSIPFVVSVKSNHLFLINNIGVEFGLGYRNTTMLFNSLLPSKRRKNIHGLELSLGVKYFL